MSLGTRAWRNYQSESKVSAGGPCSLCGAAAHYACGAMKAPTLYCAAHKDEAYAHQREWYTQVRVRSEARRDGAASVHMSTTEFRERATTPRRTALSERTGEPGPTRREHMFRGHPALGLNRHIHRRTKESSDGGV